MTRKRRNFTGSRSARFCIWTILYQDRIAFHLRLYIFGATAIVILFYLFNIIGENAAFGGLIVGGLSVASLVWFLITARKKALLAIEDPELREVAHEAMIVYLSRKQLSRKEKAHLMRRADCRLGQC